jgi:malonyl-CoA O-methyltransferase
MPDPIMLEPARAYSLWASSYPPRAHNPVMHAEERAMLGMLPAALHGQAILDVGCGSGRYLLHALRRGAARVTGVDLSLGMLGQNATTRRICADAHHLPFPSRGFDLVNASLVAGDIPDLGAWIQELARVLTVGGHLVYSDFHPSWDRYGWQRTFRTRDGQEHALPRASHQITDHLLALARAGLEIVAIDDVNVDTHRRGLSRLWRPRRVPVAVVFHARRAER